MGCVHREWSWYPRLSGPWWGKGLPFMEVRKVVWYRYGVHLKMRENALSKAMIGVVAGWAVEILEMALGTNNDLMIWSKFFHWWTFPKIKWFSSVQSLSHVWLFATPWIAAARPPCPSPTPRVYSNPCPSSRWCHPAISSSVIPFSPCPQSPLASGSFPMSQLFAWGGQNIGISASASVKWSENSKSLSLLYQTFGIGS